MEENSKIHSFCRAIKRAKERFKIGDLVVCVLPLNEQLQEGVVEEIKQLKLSKQVIVALNKCDQAKSESINLDYYSNLLNSIY